MNGEETDEDFVLSAVELGIGLINDAQYSESQRLQVILSILKDIKLHIESDPEEDRDGQCKYCFPNYQQCCKTRPYSECLAEWRECKIKYCLS